MGASGLGALLVKEGFLTEQDRVTITKTCGQGSWAFAKCILSTGLLDEDELSAFFAERTKFVVAPKNLLDRLDPGIVEQVDRRMVSRLEVLPLEIDHHRITVAVADPLDKSTLKQLEFFTGLEVVPVIAPLSQIHEGLNRLNPEFKARPTALSNFLRNHAGAAWIKQKIVEEGDVEIPQSRQARGGALEHYDEDKVEEVALDDEIDAMDDSSDLNDIDASGLDEGVGNSDFDDIDLEDSGGELELAPGDDPDSESSSIDDSGLDVDDPFDNFDEAPKRKSPSVAAPSDDLEGLEAAGDIGDELWPGADDEPAKPVAKAAAPVAKKAAASDELWPEAEEEPLSAGGDDFGLDDKPAKAVKKASSFETALDDDGLSDDFGLDDKPAKSAKASALDDNDDFGLDDKPGKNAKASALDDNDDFGLDDKPVKSAKASPLDDGLSDDFGLDEKPAKPTKRVKASPLDDDFGLDGESALSTAEGLSDGLGLSDAELGLEDEPQPAANSKGADTSVLNDDWLDETPDLGLSAADEVKVSKSAAPKQEPSSLDSSDELDFGSDELMDEPAPPKARHPTPPSKAPVESTRMVQKPDLKPTPKEELEDLAGLEFAEDEETSASLRKAVHEEGSEPEFRDPNFDDDEPEETRIDLHPPTDASPEFSADDGEDTNIRLHPATEKPKAGKLEELAMGFGDDDAIDDAAEWKASDGPASDELMLDEKDDIPIHSPSAPARVGGRSAASLENGSMASLNATAKANEALLRMSLCFDRDTAFEIAREYLPQISATGCLVTIGKTTETQAIWRSGAQSAAKGQAAVYQRLAKAAKPGHWSEIPVSAQDDFGPVKAISVYKVQRSDGLILLLAGDYPRDDDSLREALTSLAEQLGAKEGPLAK